MAKEQNEGTETAPDTNKEMMSEFNEAKLQIFRLNDSWMRIKDFRRNGNMTAYKWELDCVWDELTSKARIKDKEKYFGKIKELDKAIVDAATKTTLYNALRMKEQYCRQVQEEVGMGGKFKESDEGMDY